ncbi:hypothetical protein BgiMline_022018 [Biomphalaria glabrata]
MVRKMDQSDDLCSVIAAIYDTSVVQQRQQGNHCSRIRDDSAWFSCNHREQLSGMWLRWSLTTLYVLQLLVLSSMVAAYIYSNMSKTSAHETPQNVSQVAAVDSTAQEQKTGPSNSEPQVRLKPISLAYLKENLKHVTSQADFTRLFVGLDVKDAQLSQLLEGNQSNLDYSDNFRIAENGSSLQEVELESPDYQNDNAASFESEVFQAAVHHAAEDSTMQYPCKVPTPYIHCITDPLQPLKLYLPECVQLHRCMNFSGCCKPPDMECGPKKVDHVRMAFLVVTLVDNGHVLKESPDQGAILLYLQNHTECGCMFKRKANECTKQCPAPFRLTREGHNCVCQCFPNGKKFEEERICKKIMNGLQELSHSGLVCIKENKCYEPSCVIGKFNILKGVCPLSEEYMLHRYLFNSSAEQMMYYQHLYRFQTTPSYNTTLRPRTRRPSTARWVTTPKVTTTISMDSVNASQQQNKSQPRPPQKQFSSHAHHEKPHRKFRNRKKDRGNAKLAPTTVPKTKPTAPAESSTNSTATLVTSTSPSFTNEKITKDRDNTYPITRDTEPVNSTAESPGPTNNESTVTANTTETVLPSDVPSRKDEETATSLQPDLRTISSTAESLKTSDNESERAINTVETMFQSDMPARPGDSSFGKEGVNKRSLGQRSAHHAIPESLPSKEHLSRASSKVDHSENKRSSESELLSLHFKNSKVSNADEYYESSGEDYDQ